MSYVKPVEDVKPVDLEGISPGKLVLFTPYSTSPEAVKDGGVYFAKFQGTPRTVACRGDAEAMVEPLDDRIRLDDLGVLKDDIICVADWSAIATRDAEKVRGLLRPTEGHDEGQAQIEAVVAAWDAIYPHYKPQKYA